MTTYWSTRRDLGTAPAGLLAWLATALEGELSAWQTSFGGFSPGIAARVSTVGGRRAFVKAVDGSANPDTPGLFRDEARALSILGSTAGAGEVVAPLLDVYDDGDWVALLLTEVDGATPTQPFVAAEVEVIGSSLQRLASFLETVATDADLPRLGPDSGMVTRWEEVAAEHADEPGLDPWIRANLDLLVSLGTRAGTAIAGDSLLHFDMRSDNMLLTGQGTGDRRAVFVDWAWLRRGARWCDAALFAFDLATSPGEVGPERFVAGSPLLRGCDPLDVTAFVAAVTGAMTMGSMRAAAPGLPGMRDWQAQMASGGLRWLRERVEHGLV